jgi:arylformamidase
MPPNTEAASLSAPLAIGEDADDREPSRRAHIDRAYDNSAAFPDVPEWRETWLRRSRAVPIQPLARLDIPYGAAPAQKLDTFPHADCAAATAIFVHGGFWSRNSKETFRFLVRGIHAAGLNAVFVGHTLAPQAGMDEIVCEVRTAARWTSAHLAELGFALRPLILIGWSSGAQLAAMAMSESHVGGGMGISGIYDLEPMRHGSINEILKLDGEAAQRNSPALHPAAKSGPFIVAHGQCELVAFRSQSENFHAARTEAGLSGPIIALPGHHHHSILDALYERDGALTQALARLALG